MTDQPIISEVSMTIIADLTKRIAELTAQRETYVANVNAEINRQIGMYDGQITEIKRVIDMLTPKPPDPPNNGNGGEEQKSSQADIGSSTEGKKE